MKSTADDNSVVMLRVGEQCPVIWPKVGRQTGCMTILEPTGFWVYIAFLDMTASEKKSLKGTAVIRFVIENGICFFLYKFGDMNWMDTPFYPAIIGNSYVPLSEPDQDQRYSMTILGVEAGTGILVSCRLIGLDHKISKEFYDWYEKFGKTPITRNEYNKRILDVYASYTTRQLVQLAQERNLPVMVTTMH